MNVLRAGLAPPQIAARTKGDFIRAVQHHRRGRRMWRFKVEQVWEKACTTVAAPHGQDAGMREVVRLVARLDFIGDQLDAVADELQGLLETVPEATHLRTLPGLGWVSVAALIAEIGPFGRYRHGRQLVKLAGLQPSRRESGRTPAMQAGLVSQRLASPWLNLNVPQGLESCVGHGSSAYVTLPNSLVRSRSRARQVIPGPKSPDPINAPPRLLPGRRCLSTRSGNRPVIARLRRTRNVRIGRHRNQGQLIDVQVRKSMFHRTRHDEIPVPIERHTGGVDIPVSGNAALVVRRKRS